MATERGKALAFRFVHEVEAGLVDDPKDPGGITNFGVSLRFLRGAGIDIDGDGRITREDILKLTPEKAQAIYDAHFWKPSACDSLPDALALAVYDCAVNQGVGTARKLLDEARAWAGRGASAEQVLRDLLTLRSIRYTKTKNFDTYGRGWLRRVHACGILAGSLL